jgi:inhibitor of KinA sporulation pathway (predicted exonuclease)
MLSVPTVLKQMVAQVGLEFVGRPHSGLDDSLNIANVVLKLLEFGHIFVGPEVIPEGYEPPLNSFHDYNRAPAIFSRLPV